MNLKNSRILLTGGSGFLGSSILHALMRSGVPKKRITLPRSAKTDLRSKEYCDLVVKGHDIVIHLAGNVGGIGKNRDFPYTLWRDNTLMGVHLLDAARKERIKKFVMVGTICEYPKHTPVPFREEDLWIGYPEETNAPYGVAKKNLLVGGQSLRAEHNMNVIHILPVNLYGPNDHFDPAVSHVIPALIKKFAEAKEAGLPEVNIWGTGKATREFLYVADAAKGILLAAEKYDKPEPVNLGSGMEISILDLATQIAAIVGYNGELKFDPAQPDGQPRRCLDVSKAEKEFGFKATTSFRDGLTSTVAWYYKHVHGK